MALIQFNIKMNSLKMGYLSQKKYKIRENFFLYFSAIILALLTCIYFIEDVFSINLCNPFIVYCLSGILILYSFIVKKNKLVVCFCTIFIVNYTILSANANIFINNKFNGIKSIDLLFSATTPFKNKLNKNDISSTGSLILANKYIVPYAELHGGVPIIVIKVDLRDVKKDELSLVFKHLSDFILKQQKAVVVFGDFALSTWDTEFIDFLHRSNLEVKNCFVFNGDSFLRFLKKPSFFILGFEALGISNLQFINDKEDIIATISFGL